MPERTTIDPDQYCWPAKLQLWCAGFSRDCDSVRLRGLEPVYDGPLKQNGAGARPGANLRDEFFVFLIIVALVWPLIAVGVVGGYGFAVWMYQIVAGPPGPPKR